MHVLKPILLLAYIILLIIPGYTIAASLGGQNPFTDPAGSAYFMQRLLGLYAIVLMFIQLIIGSWMIQLRRIFGGKLLQYHIRQGLIAYGLILLHPTMYFLFNTFAVNVQEAVTRLLPSLTFPIPPSEMPVTYGRLGLLFLTCGVFAALFRTKPLISKHWRWFHILNYLAFFSIILHSQSIGSDTHSLPFAYLYPLFYVGLASGLIYRRIYIPIKNSRRSVPPPTAPQS